MINFTTQQINEMEEMYRQNYTRQEIANKFNTSIKVIYNRTKNVLRNFDNKDWLENMYFVQRINKRSIAKIARCNEMTIHKNMKKFGIITDDSISRNQKYVFNKDFFESIDSKEKAYWLGFIAADGGISNKPSQRRLSILLSRKDEYHLQKFINSINGNMEIKYGETILNNKVFLNCSVKVYSKKMVNDLEKLNVYPNKSTKEIPPNIDNFYICDFIRGLFDGDGCISIYGENHLLSWCIVSSKEMCLFVKEYLEKTLNIHLSFSPDGNLYRVHTGTRDYVVKIMEWMYKDTTIYLDRKYQIYQSYKLRLEDIV